ncbi:MAG: lactonase family protein, partial [Actinomycetota bacterium]|nr:lactonase family protein [Actinomycetota bacterium]
MTDGTVDGAVYVQTNEPLNLVIAFRRDAEGSLTRLDGYSTAGAGNGEPHLPSQGSVVLSGDGGHLLVTNAGSDDVSVFAISSDGALSLLGRAPAG